MPNVFGQSGRVRAQAAEIFDRTVTRAREPVFYSRLGVADTMDGRFDLLVLHAWLALSWLKARGEADTAQALIDRIFVSFDESLRELGIGDIGIGHRVKKMADAFYGRLDAYSAAAGEAGLAAAIMRNIFRSDHAPSEAARSIARYANAAQAILKAGPPELDFGALPGA